MLGAMNFARCLKALLALVICVHLLLDMAMPWVPGAFRMGAEESVAAILHPRLLHQSPKLPPELKIPAVSFDIARRKVLIPPSATQAVNGLATTPIQTRHDTSVDPSPPSRAEDH